MILTNGEPDKAQVHHLPALTADERARLHGRVRCRPTAAVTAGTSVRLRFAFCLGQQGLAAGGALRLAWRWPFDWGPLQSDDPQAAGYVRLSTDAPAKLACHFEPRGDLNPWQHHLQIDVLDGTLPPASQVDLDCGADPQGWAAPTFCAEDGGFIGLVRYNAANDWIRLEGPPAAPIVAGPPVNLRLLGPSLAGIGQPLEYIVRAEDRWGNPAALPAAPVLRLDHNRLDASLEPLATQPTYRALVHLDTPGLHRLTAAVPDTDLQATGNPLRVTKKPPATAIYWGDLHSGQTHIGCGAGPLENHFAYARDAAGLQFASQQANDHYIDRPTWDHVRQVSAAFDRAGRMVTFLGCEWSPLTPQGGDRNVVYRDDTEPLHRSGRFYTEDRPDPTPDLPTAAEFLPAMRGQPVLINMHVGGRPTNLDFHEPAIEKLAEIHSTHGTSEWFVLDALRRGYRVGITAGADGVMGRPGACRPGRRVTRNVRSGLTAVLAPKLDRTALWQAFHQRRCYATTGERILLEFWVNGKPMGACTGTARPPQIRIRVAGTAPLERVDLLRGTAVLCSWDLAQALRPPDPPCLRLLWGGTEGLGTAHVQRALWQGELTLEEGTLKAVRPVGLQTAADRVVDNDPGRVLWQSATAGNLMGFNFEVHGPPQARLRVKSNRGDFACTVEEIRQTAYRHTAGGHDCRLLLGPAPAPGAPDEIDLDYRDPAPLKGEHPYWVRVVQTDQERAWSSPVYLRYKG